MSEIWLSDERFYGIKVKESFDGLSKAITSIVTSGGWLVVHDKYGKPLAVNPDHIAVITPLDDEYDELEDE